MIYRIAFYLFVTNIFGVCPEAFSQDQEVVPTIEQLFQKWDAANVVRPTRIRSTWIREQGDSNWSEMLTDGSSGLKNTRFLTGRKIVGWNQQYWFELSSTTQDQPQWTLAGIDKLPMPEQMTRHRDLFWIPDTEVSTHLAGYKLKDFFSHPAVKISKIQWDPKNSDCLRVDFSVSAEKAKFGSLPIKIESGSAIFSKSRGFLLVGFQAMIAGSSYRQEYSDVLVNNRLSTLPEKITSNHLGRETIQINELKFDSIDPEEFRITFYGFTEPPGIFQEDSKWFSIWTILTVAVCIAVAYAIRNSFAARQ